MIQAGIKLTEGGNITFNSLKCVKGAEFCRPLYKSLGIVKTSDLAVAISHGTLDVTFGNVIPVQKSVQELLNLLY